LIFIELYQCPQVPREAIFSALLMLYLYYNN
jgi:hypothetical protein